MTSILKVGEIQDPANSNSALSIDASGQVLLSAIPYIRMQSTGSVSTTTTSNHATVPFNNVIASRGITLNTSTYKFQVPVTGLYNFSGAVRWDRASSYLWWRVQDGSGTTVQPSALVLNNGNSGSFITSAGSFLCPLTASTDYLIDFGDGTNNTAVISPAQTFMAIHLVGAS